MGLVEDKQNVELMNFTGGGREGTAKYCKGFNFIMVVFLGAGLWPKFVFLSTNELKIGLLSAGDPRLQPKVNYCKAFLSKMVDCFTKDSCY